jgi:hypothetical protein
MHKTKYAKNVYQVMIRSLIFLYNNALSHNTTAEEKQPTVGNQMLFLLLTSTQ